ncbi:MAG: response regulator transcription factor [Kiritimatiellae bacterium]|nr:response regulator transcription factor [Kiritimatiellia bacterium]
MNQAKKTTVLLTDDHAVVRMGLAAIINLESDLAVCGEAEDGATAARLAGELRPDVIVMDFRMPGMDGAEATAAVLRASPGSRVLILTTYGTSAEIARALDAGATGAVTKDMSNAALADTIRATARGERRLSPEIAATIEDAEHEIALTPRQRQVLDSITRGLSNDDITKMLGISKSRVKQHLNEVYNKLGAANRAEAVAIAMRRQLLKV